MEWGLAQVGREREPSPEGKRVEEVLVASEEIIAPSDPYPRLVNLIHVKTRDPVLRREVLLGVGEPWSADKVEESERNLRRLGILAIARIVPVKGRAPDGVGLLVITKDLLEPAAEPGVQLRQRGGAALPPAPHRGELPRLRQAGGAGSAAEGGHAGARPVVRGSRLLGTRLSLTENASVIFNRHTHLAEGSFGSFDFGLPLYTLDQEHGFDVGASWVVQRARVFRGPSVWQLPYPDATAPTGTVPYIYDDREVAGGAAYTRSFGTRYKTNVTVGVAGFSRRFGAPPEAELSDEQRAWLQARYLPEERGRGVPGRLGARLRGPLQGDAQPAHLRPLRGYQLGHMVLIQARWSDPAFLSPQRFVEAGASVRYRWLLADDLLTLTAAGAAR